MMTDKDRGEILLLFRARSSRSCLPAAGRQGRQAGDLAVIFAQTYQSGYRSRGLRQLPEDPAEILCRKPKKMVKGWC